MHTTAPDTAVVKLPSTAPRRVLVLTIQHQALLLPDDIEADELDLLVHTLDRCREVRTAWIGTGPFGYHYVEGGQPRVTLESKIAAIYPDYETQSAALQQQTEEAAK